GSTMSVTVQSSSLSYAARIAVASSRSSVRKVPCGPFAQYRHFRASSRAASRAAAASRSRPETPYPCAPASSATSRSLSIKSLTVILLADHDAPKRCERHQQPELPRRERKAANGKRHAEDESHQPVLHFPSSWSR